MISAWDIDGSVLGYNFTDEGSGAGWLTLYGVKWAGVGTLFVYADELSSVGYYTGTSAFTDLIRISVVDNENQSSLDLLMTINVLANVAPTVTAPATASLFTNSSLRFGSDSLNIGSQDVDGTVVSYRLTDATPGAGHIMHANGVQIAGTSVTVSKDLLDQYYYTAGSTIGTNQITIEAIDELGLASAPVTTTFTVLNRPPTIVGPPEVNKHTLESFAFTSLAAGNAAISASDSDGTVVRYRFLDSEPGVGGHLTFDGQAVSTLVEIAPADLGRVGYYTGTVLGSNRITIQAIDNLLGLGTLTMQINVANQAPTISGPTSIIRSTYQLFDFTSLISATDADGTVVSYTFSDTTPGDAYLTLDDVKIEGTSVTVSAANLGQVGYYTGTSPGSNAITIQATDNLGLVSTALTMTIATGPNTAPTITGPARVFKGTNQTFDFTSGCALITAADLDGEIASYRFTDSMVGAGHLTLDGGMIAGTSVTVSAADLGRVAYSTGPIVGTNAIAVEAIDNAGASSPYVLVMTINVTDTGNLAPTISGPASVILGTNLSFDETDSLFSSLITAADADGSVAVYVFTDSTPGAGLLTLNGAPITGTSLRVLAAELDQVGYNTGSSAGSNSIAIEAVDNLGLATSMTMTIIVDGEGSAGNQAPTISGPAVVDMDTNGIFTFSTTAADGNVVLVANDVDGAVAMYRFSDMTPGAGSLVYNGAFVESRSKTVPAADLELVMYHSGRVAGSNSIVIEAIDNLGLASTTVLTMAINVSATGGTGNQAPTIGGPASVSKTVNESFTFTSLISAADADGSVEQFRFWDNMPGAGYLRRGDTRIEGTSVTVSAAELGQVNYYTGESIGSNSIAIEAIDDMGLASPSFLTMAINVGGAGGATNQAPTISGPSSVSKATNESFTFTSLISASDVDGTVAQYRFSDSMAGAGHLELGGVAAPFTVAAANLGEVVYHTGAFAGSNSITIEAIDNLGKTSSSLLTMTINVGTGGTGGTGNQAPTISGPASVSKSINESFTFTSLLSASDPDGTVAQFRFSDSMAGAGYLTRGGLAAPSVFTVAAANLGEVGYNTGASAGSNSIAIEAIDNLGRTSPSALTMTINVAGTTGTPGTGGTGTGGTANQAPTISGQASVSKTTNESFSFTPLISATDADGTVAQYRFSDSMSGAGHLTLNGLQIAGTSVTVSAANLGQVGYYTAAVAGSNSIAIEAIDNLGQTSPNVLMMTINVAGTAATGGTGATANQAPTISGPSSLSKSINQSFDFTSLVSASDADGTVAQYRFSDNVSGAGYLTLNGAQIAGHSVTVSAANLGQVGYYTEALAGTNTIAIEAIDNQGLASPNFLMMAINVSSIGATSGAEVPFVDTSHGMAMYQGRASGYAVVSTATGYSVTIKNAFSTNELQNLDRVLFDDLASYGGGSSAVVNTAARTIDGGTGIDTLAIFGLSSQYTITHTATGFTIHHASQGSQWVTNVERLMFTDGMVALDIQGDAGMAYRLYQAAFNRTPDLAGLGFQMSALDNGLHLAQVAGNFIASPEFQSTYGNLSNEQFVRQLYANVLHREAEVEGYAYHLNHLNNGFTRADVLVGFSESPENQAALIGATQDGMIYTL
jgi:hypothetical protein